MSHWTLNAVPYSAMAFAVAGLIYFWLASRAFDRKWGRDEDRPRR